jgi:hypothetical protein
MSKNQQEVDFSDEKQTQQLIVELNELVTSLPTLKPNHPTKWDLDGSWDENKSVAIWFIDQQYIPLFERFRDLKCKTIKLVNLETPAVRISFFQKHKYWVKKARDLDPHEQQQRISTYLANLQIYQQTLRGKLPSPSATEDERIRKELQLVDSQQKQWREILENNHQYEIVCSNYHQRYYYTTVNWKFRLESGAYANSSEHLLNHQRDRMGTITQIRKNVIFIDSSQITKQHDQQNKEIEDYLNSFPVQSLILPSIPNVFARVRPEVEIMQQFDKK